MFSKLTIAGLMTRLNVFTMLVSMTIGGAFLYAIQAMGGNIEEIGRARLPSVIALQTIDIQITEMVLAESRFLLSDDPRTRAQFADQAQALRQRVPAMFDTYKRYFRDEQDRIRFERVTTLWARLDQILEKQHGEERANNFASARAIFDGEVVPVSTDLAKALDSALDDVNADAKDAADSGTRTAQVGLILAIVATILATGSSVGVLVLSRKRVLVPLARLNRGLAQMAGGDFAADIPGAGHADEIGAIARSVDAIKTAAAARAAAESAAQKHVVDALGEALQAMAAGQMTHRIDHPFPAEFDRLRAIFNQAMADLDDLIGKVSGTAGAVKSASGELTSASQDLARRTEVQATRLESTASAIASLTETVRATARGALDVKSGAELAQTQAASGAGVANDAMAAMGGIAGSSNQISQITDMIDSIAFQTNLLALNAGVEAARAGDAGKGFAVVANEVRALAQRSTDAARSIKQLIADSTAQVDLGVKLVAKSGEALVGIVGKVTELKALIEGISDATGSQAADLEALSASVREMETMTQHNAAMVEEVSGSASNLQQESDKMTSLVQRFAASTGTVVPLHRAAPATLRAAAPRPPSGNLAIRPVPAATTDDWSEF